MCECCGHYIHYLHSFFFTYCCDKIPWQRHFNGEGANLALVAKEYNPSYSRQRRLGSKNGKLTGWSHCIHTCEVGSEQQVRPGFKASSSTQVACFFYQCSPSQRLHTQCSETMLLAGEQVFREVSLYGPLPIPTLHTVWS